MNTLDFTPERGGGATPFHPPPPSCLPLSPTTPQQLSKPTTRGLLIWRKAVNLRIECVGVMRLAASGGGWPCQRRQARSPRWRRWAPAAPRPPAGRQTIPGVTGPCNRPGSTKGPYSMVGVTGQTLPKAHILWSV